MEFSNWSDGAHRGCVDAHTGCAVYIETIDEGCVLYVRSEP